jgi:hypothetical protein
MDMACFKHAYPLVAIYRAEPFKVHDFFKTPYHQLLFGLKPH